MSKHRERVDALRKRVEYELEDYQRVFPEPNELSVRLRLCVDLMAALTDVFAELEGQSTQVVTNAKLLSVSLDAKPGPYGGRIELVPQTQYGVRFGDGEVDEMVDLADAVQLIKTTREHIADDLLEAEDYEPMVVVKRSVVPSTRTPWTEVSRDELDRH